MQIVAFFFRPNGKRLDQSGSDPHFRQLSKCRSPCFRCVRRNRVTPPSNTIIEEWRPGRLLLSFSRVTATECKLVIPRSPVRGRVGRQRHERRERDCIHTVGVSKMQRFMNTDLSVFFAFSKIERNQTIYWKRDLYVRFGILFLF